MALLRSLVICFVTLFYVTHSVANELVETIKRVKPSVVGVGVYTPSGNPKNQLHGTGFVIGNGLYVVTNDHVIPKELNTEIQQRMVIFTGTGKKTQYRLAQLIGSSKQHDLAILKIEGQSLPSMRLAKRKLVDEGMEVAFTGFPIGAILGLYPATHRGMISAVTPLIEPVKGSGQLTASMLKRLRNPVDIYQLDATAYPGNSGSALYNAKSGEVIGVINKVLVQGNKEHAISAPSGITYAIPVQYVYELAEKLNIIL